MEDELVALMPARASSSRTIWRMRISDMPSVFAPIPPTAEPAPTPVEAPVPPKPWLPGAGEVGVPTEPEGLVLGRDELPGEPG